MKVLQIDEPKNPTQYEGIGLTPKEQDYVMHRAKKFKWKGNMNVLPSYECG
jgi:hypothetical protein